MNILLETALEYEKNGLYDEASQICLQLLSENPLDIDAAEILDRIEQNGTYETLSDVNLEMLSLFLSKDINDQMKFKKWLLTL